MKHYFSLNSTLILIITLFVPSCESLKKDPEFVGTWQFSEKINSDEIVYNTTRTITFTKSTYEEIYKIQRENAVVISAIIGTRGNIAMTHSNLVFELKELGTCTLDESEICTGSLRWFGEGTKYWTDNIVYFKKLIMGVFEVTGTKLRLTRDLNRDGDYEDTGEDVTFEMI
jgi:limonene-1,2-epoxide hydrolase